MQMYRKLARCAIRAALAVALSLPGAAGIKAQQAAPPATPAAARPPNVRPNMQDLIAPPVPYAQAMAAILGRTTPAARPAPPAAATNLCNTSDPPSSSHWQAR
jgi:hypothetical protein